MRTSDSLDNGTINGPLVSGSAAAVPPRWLPTRAAGPPSAALFIRADLTRRRAVVHLLPFLCLYFYFCVRRRLFQDCLKMSIMVEGST